jgi:hypothetical protein
MKQSSLTRRDWLASCLFSGGLLGLRSIASGLPVAAITNPQKWLASISDEAAAAQIRAVSTSTPQFLVMSASDSGEPLNCNVPGMYLGQGFLHPTADSMAQTTFALNAQNAVAAKCWTSLGAATLAQTCFFHHATYSFAHGDLSGVHRLGGAIAAGEMMVSAFAKALSEPLKTIQPQPINISAQGGVELLSYGGVQQPMFSPTAIKSMLSTDESLAVFAQSQTLRDRDLNAIHALAKQSASKAQVALIDSMVTSQAQARALPSTLFAQLGSISDDEINSQMTVAALLCQMRLAPVVVVHIPFGGDNHVDQDAHDGPGALPGEAAQHVAAMAAINGFKSAVQTAGMSREVTFATLTTFGRGNAPPDYSGRAHNGLHTCNLIMGPNVSGSVVGGADLVVSDNAPQAQAIDPVTGKGGAGGAIPYEKTLASFGATLGAALGVTDDVLATIVPSGTKVAGALTSTV